MLAEPRMESSPRHKKNDITAACATAQQAGADDTILPFACSDIVVIGRIENEAYEHVESEQDLLGRGWVSARLKVQRVVKGAGLPAVLSVRYLTHNHIRQDRDFMFVLKPTDTESYEIRTGQPMFLRPRLAMRCE